MQEEELPHGHQWSTPRTEGGNNVWQNNRDDVKSRPHLARQAFESKMVEKWVNRHFKGFQGAFIAEKL